MTCARRPDNFFSLLLRLMLNVLEKLLILQDRDRKITRLQSELANVEPERQSFQSRVTASQTHLEAVRLRQRQLETHRKELELEVEAKKQQIERYSLQQYQTKKNEEYRALAHEIELCKEAIVKLEDQQLELMEQGDVAQKELSAVAQTAKDVQKQVEELIADLAGREQNLKKQLADLTEDYDQLRAAVDDGVRLRYERLRKLKGGSTVVGIEHGVCGGCHVKLPVQIVVSCQAQQEIISCPNCGRILYHSPDMDLAVAD